MNKTVVATRKQLIDDLVDYAYGFYMETDEDKYESELEKLDDEQLIYEYKNVILNNDSEYKYKVEIKKKGVNHGKEKFTREEYKSRIL